MLVIESQLATRRGRGRRTKYERTFPDLNDYQKKYAAHWAAGAAMKRDYTHLVRDLAVVTRQPKWCEPVKVLFVWVEEDDARDLDNVAFAKKFVLDGLVEAGVIEDDDRAHVTGWRDEFPRPDPQRPRVEVHLTPADSEGWIQR